MANNGWTDERRARQAEAIRSWQPWRKSTGPRSPEGKARASRNADKGGKRAELRAELAMLRELLRKLDIPWSDST